MRHYHVTPLLAMFTLTTIGVSLFGVPAFAESTCVLSPAVQLEVGIGTIGSTTGLTDYVAQAYKFIVGSIGIISAVMIMFNGIRWATAGGNAEMLSTAKAGMSNAVIGLLIALMSYVLLFALNAKLVNLVDVCPTGLAFDTDPSTSWTTCPGGSASECSSVSYCQYAGGCECANIGTTAAKYVCRPVGSNVLPEGTACQTDDNCISPLKCQGASATDAGTCTQSTEGNTCSSDADCSEGLTCVELSSVTKKCLEKTNRDNGDYCEEDTECASGVCNETAGIDQCVNGDGTDGNNLPCTDNDDCKTGYSCESYACTAKTEGSDCDSENVECGSGLYCVEVGLVNTGTCYNGSAGDPCDHNNECVSRSCISDECQ